MYYLKYNDLRCKFKRDFFNKYACFQLYDSDYNFITYYDDIFSLSYDLGLPLHKIYDSLRHHKKVVFRGHLCFLNYTFDYGRDYEY